MSEPPRPAVAPTFVSIRFVVPDGAGWENARRWLVGQRKRSRLTQRDMAALMGTTQGEVSRFETGRGDPRLSTIMRYVRALGLRANVHAERMVDD